MPSLGPTFVTKIVQKGSVLTGPEGGVIMPQEHTSFGRPMCSGFSRGSYQASMPETIQHAHPRRFSADHDRQPPLPNGSQHSCELYCPASPRPHSELVGDCRTQNTVPCRGDNQSAGTMALRLGSWVCRARPRVLNSLTSIIDRASTWSSPPCISSSLARTTVQSAGRRTYASDAPAQMSPLARTALYDLHRKYDAKLVPFSGYEMPVQYADLSVGDSHIWTREKASLFDVGHM